MNTLEISLTDWAYGGEALGRDPDGRAVFVAFAIPGERVRVEVLEEHAHWARARLLEVIQASPHRVDPRCRHFAVCGGCHYQHAAYPAQLLAKAAIVRSQLERLGGFRNPPVHPTVPSPSPWNTRNFVQFSLGPGGRLGFQAAGTHDVIAIEECHLPEPALTGLWPRVDLEAVPGLTRVGLRSAAEGEAQLTLEAETEADVSLELDAPVSVVWIGPASTEVLVGSRSLPFEVQGRRFQVSAGSFFQVHTSLAGALVEAVLAGSQIHAGELVLDLYCGVGLFSAFLAQAGARVVGIEQSPVACQDFEANLGEFDAMELYEATVEQALPEIHYRPRVVVADPPRAGLGSAVTEALTALRPERLVYVSCDPATLARDGKRLAEAGYSLRSVTPYDLFPQTFHVETVSVWER